tara:strand:+ start:2284 stop:3132 length:849 start_codon:yes stop_codon:yes gene_type:complete
MKNNVCIKARAKLNLFLRVLSKKDNGYHNINSGLTFLDLSDELRISLSEKNNISYTGDFKPVGSFFKNDILIKTLKILSFEKKIYFDIKIKKNIPWKAGLGSASTDAAALIRGLQQLNVIDNIDEKKINKIGADVIACYYGRNCFVSGIGDKINKNINYPKLYFVLVNPNIRLSTQEMYQKIDKYIKFEDKLKNTIKDLNENSFINNHNDFEKIIKTENKKILNILEFLSKIKNNLFVRMTGSGGCCFAAFTKKSYAEEAFGIISENYKNYWTYLAENNVNN